MTGTACHAERSDILAGLSSADEEVRRLAVERLVLLEPAESLERLGQALGDESWRVRKTAVARLVSGGASPEVQAMLVEALADGENPGRRNSACEALVACGSDVLPRLVDELGSPDVDVRKQVVDALAGLGDAAARGPLDAALDDPDANVRAAAAEALGVVGGIDQIEHLLVRSTASDEDVLVRFSALRALIHLEASVGVARLGETLEQALLRPAGIELLGFSSDPQASEVLLKALTDGHRASREAAMGACLRALSRLDGDDASDFEARLRRVAAGDPALLQSACARLAEGDLTGRMTSIQFLGVLADPAAVRPILEAGRDDALEELADTTLASLGTPLADALAAGWTTLDGDLRLRACRLLGRVGGETAERLLARALSASDVTLRCVAAKALAQGGFVARLTDLSRGLERAARDVELEGDEEVSTLVRAIVALAARPEAVENGLDVQLIELLRSRLAGAPEAVRLAIAQVLSRLGRREDEDVLGYLLKDESPAVRRAAVEALERFPFEQVQDVVRLALGDESSLVRVAAVGVLGASQRPAALEELARQVQDDEPRVVAAAIRALGRIHRETDRLQPEARRLLRDALAGEPIVALAALEALRAIGGEDAGRVALAGLDRPEPDVVRSTVACLGDHAPDAMLGQLLPLVAHADWSVRAEVIRVFADRAHRRALPALLGRLEVEEDPFVRRSVLHAVDRLED